MELLANLFLRLIQTQTLDELISELQDAYNRGGYMANLVPYFVGYIACVSVGLIVLVLIPFIGCCLCCCRTQTNYHEPWKQKSRVWLYCMLIFCVASLAICSQLFEKNDAVVKETSASQGVIRDMDQGFEMLHRYRETVITQLNSSVHRGLYRSKEGMVTMMGNLPQSIRSLLGKTYSELNSSFSYIEGVLGNMTAEFSRAEKGMKALNGNITQLTNNMKQRAGDLSKTMLACLYAPCLNVNKTYTWRMKVKASPVNYDAVTSSRKNTTMLIRNFARDSDAALTELSNTSGGFNLTVNNEVNDLKKAMNVVVKNTTFILKGHVSSIRELLPLTEYRDLLKSVTSTVDEYGRVRSGITLVLAIIACVVISITIIGVLVGCVGVLLHGKIGAYLARGSSIVLTYSSNFILFISWFWMLATTLMFTLGSIARNEGCRYLTYQPEVRSAVPKIDKLMSPYINSILGIPFNLSLLSAANACKENASLYDALAVRRTGYDIDTSFGIRSAGMNVVSNLNIQNITGTVKKTDEKLSKITALLSDFSKSMRNLQMNSVKVEFQKTTVDLDLIELAAIIRDLPKNKKMSAQKLSNKTAEELSRKMEALYLEVIKVDNMKASLLGRLKSLENQARNLFLIMTNRSISLAITKMLENDAKAVFDGVTEHFVTQVKTNIGKCRPAFDACAAIVKAPCENLLGPFNAIWFVQSLVQILLFAMVICGHNLVKYFKFLQDSSVRVIRVRALPRTPDIFRRPRVSPDVFDVTEKTVHTVNKRHITGRREFGQTSKIEMGLRF